MQHYFKSIAFQLHYGCILLALSANYSKVMVMYNWVMKMKIEIITPSGIFEILQNATFGELLISILLTALLVVNIIYFLWRVACREGWI